MVEGRDTTTSKSSGIKLKECGVMPKLSSNPAEFLQRVVEEIKGSTPTEVFKNIEEEDFYKAVYNLDVIIEWCKKMRVTATALDSETLWPIWPGLTQMDKSE